MLPRLCVDYREGDYSFYLAPPNLRSIKQRNNICSYRREDRNQNGINNLLYHENSRNFESLEFLVHSLVHGCPKCPIMNMDKFALITKWRLVLVIITFTMKIQSNVNVFVGVQPTGRRDSF